MSLDIGDGFKLEISFGLAAIFWWVVGTLLFLALLNRFGFQLLKSIVKFLIIFSIFLFIIGSVYYSKKPKELSISLPQLAQEINQGKVKKITIAGDKLEIFYQDNSKTYSHKESEIDLFESLINYGVDKTKLAEVEIGIKKRRGSGAG